MAIKSMGRKVGRFGNKLTAYISDKEEKCSSCGSVIPAGDGFTMSSRFGQNKREPVCRDCWPWPEDMVNLYTVSIVEPDYDSLVTLWERQYFTLPHAFYNIEKRIERYMEHTPAVTIQVSRDEYSKSYVMHIMRKQAEELTRNPPDETDFHPTVIEPEEFMLEYVEGVMERWLLSQRGQPPTT